MQHIFSLSYKRHRHHRILPYLPLVLILLAALVGVAGKFGGAFAADFMCPHATDKFLVVMQGQTLSAIAATNNTTYQQLATYNGIKNPNVIEVAQKICLPPMESFAMPVLPQSDYVRIAELDATAFGLPVTLFVRQINAESNFNPNALSPAGAIGIAQFEPGTAAALGVNPNNPLQSLHGAAQLMASYVAKYGSFEKALAAYNAGEGRLQSALQQAMQFGGDYKNYLPQETQNYIRKIEMGN